VDQGHDDPFDSASMHLGLSFFRFVWF